MYEVIPARLDWPMTKVIASIRQTLDPICDTGVLCLNIPEILDSPIPKMEPRLYAKLIQEQSPIPFEMIVNRVVVHAPLSEQLTWLSDTHRNFHIDTFIFVGGASQDGQYPGPSVSQLMQHAQKYSVGGILIPHRLEKDSGMDEAHRVIQKQKAGISFFTSQVLYDIEPLKKFLWQYHELLCQEKLSPLPLFLSFSPISSERDIAFYQKLQVLIPKHVLQNLRKHPKDMAAYSLDVVEALFEEIFSFVQKFTPQMRLGINVEYITHHNRLHSYELLRKFSKRTSTLARGSE